jgi:hypothetical protein
MMRIFEPKREKIAGNWRKLRKSFMVFIHHILLRRSNRGGSIEQGMRHIWGRGKDNARSWCGSLKKRTTSKT